MHDKLSVVVKHGAFFDYNCRKLYLNQILCRSVLFDQIIDKTKRRLDAFIFVQYVEDFWAGFLTCTESIAHPVEDSVIISKIFDQFAVYYS